MHIKITSLLQEKIGTKYKYSAYHIYTHMGYPRDVVKLLYLKVRKPNKYKARLKVWREAKKKVINT